VTVGMVKSAGLLSSSSVVVMRTLRGTTLHPQGLGDPELSPSPKAALLLLEESSRCVEMVTHCAPSL
jgi:hypothetical protein